VFGLLERFLQRTPWPVQILIVFAFAVAVHYGQMSHTRFADAEALAAYESIAQGEQFPAVGREVAKSGFRTGPFEFYLMALPYALGLGHAGARWWFLLLVALPAPMLMWVFGRFRSRGIGWLAGLAAADPGSLLTAMGSVQNNELLAPFATAAFCQMLRMGLGPKQRHRDWLLLGLLAGLLPQVHFSAVLFFPAAAVWLAWRKPRFQVLDAVLFSAAATVPWISYVFFQVGHGWVDVVALWNSGLADHMPQAGLPRAASWLLLFASPEGAFALLSSLVFAAAIVTRRVKTERADVIAIWLLVVAELVVPLVAYDFFKRHFLAFFVPVVPALVALTPDLWASITRGTDGVLVSPKARRRIVAGVALTVVFLPPPFWMFRGPAERLDVEENLVFMARHACELGLPAENLPWSNFVVSAHFAVPDSTWSYLRRQYAPACPPVTPRTVVAQRIEEYRSQAGDTVVDHKTLRFFSFLPDVTWQTKSAPPDHTMAGEIGAEEKTLIFSYRTHPFQEYDRIPNLVVDGQAIPVTRQCRSHPRDRFGGTYLFVFDLPTAGKRRSFSLVAPEGARVIASPRLFTRRVDFVCEVAPRP
jgi:hypothetical protein